jgi:hypothetical protein
MNIKWSYIPTFLISLGTAFFIVSMIFVSQHKVTQNNSSQVLGQYSNQSSALSGFLSSSISSSKSFSSSSSLSSSSSFSSESLVLSDAVSDPVSSAQNKQSSGPVKTVNYIRLAGINCNGYDRNYSYSAPIDGFCKVIDHEKETARIYFGDDGALLTKPSEGGFKTMAGGSYTYFEVVRKTDNFQYIRYTIEYIEGGYSYRSWIYRYDFATKKLSFVEVLKFQWLNYPYQEIYFQSVDKPECSDINLSTFWNYDCFYIVNRTDWDNPTNRYELTQEEKDKIDKTKKDYLYYTQQAEIYGLPKLFAKQ